MKFCFCCPEYFGKIMFENVEIGVTFVKRPMIILRYGTQLVVTLCQNLHFSLHKFQSNSMLYHLSGSIFDHAM